MYAVIELNNNQYVIKENEDIIIDKFDTDSKKKDIQIKNILLLKDKEKILIGKPYLDNVTVNADVVKDIKGKKVIVFKYKKRKGYRKKQGHRQPYTVIKIKNISVK